MEGGTAKRAAAGAAAVLSMAALRLAPRACGPESLAAKVLIRGETPNQRFLGEIHGDPQTQAWFAALGIDDRVLIAKGHSYCTMLAGSNSAVADIYGKHPNMDEFRAELSVALSAAGAYCPQYLSRLDFQP